jgi:hypothetical protein
MPIYLSSQAKVKKTLHFAIIVFNYVHYFPNYPDITNPHDGPPGSLLLVLVAGSCGGCVH